MKSEQDLVAEWVDSEIEEILGRAVNERGQEEVDKLLKNQPGLLEKKKQGRLKFWQNQINLIHEDGEKLAEKLIMGMLHPNNPKTRKLYSKIKGIKLPKSATETRSYVNTLSCVVTLRETRELEARAEEDKQNREESERINSIKGKVARGEKVGGQDLLDLVKARGVKVHPRTADTLKSRVNWISSGQASVYGGQLPDKVYDLYRQLSIETKL